MPITFPHLWQPKISPDFARCSLGAKIMLIEKHWGWQPLVNAKTSEWKLIRNRIFIVSVAFTRRKIETLQWRNLVEMILMSHQRPFFMLLLCFYSFKPLLLSSQEEEIYGFHSSFAITDSEINKLLNIWVMMTYACI